MLSDRMTKRLREYIPMNGQTKLSKKEIIDEFIKNTKPYEKPLPIKFNLRAYASYISEHKLTISDITPEIMQKFILN